MENKVQELNFELMKLASFNSFDGEYIVKSLKAHPDLWAGVIMDRAGHSGMNTPPYTACMDLIKLRDIGDDLWNVDTIFIMPKDGKEKELEILAKTWDADEVSYESMDYESYAANKKILRVWFD